jgi:predicted ribosomally synthesized peptide with SipW-like signal peptide
MTMGGAGAAAGAGTIAYFSDSEKSTGNSISAGTLTLDFDTNPTFAFSSSLAPGDTTTGSITLLSDGSLDGSLDIDVSVSENDGSNVSSPNKGAQEVADRLDILTLSYDNTNLKGQIDSTTTPPALADLVTNDQGSGEDTPNDLVDLPDPGDGTEFSIELELQDGVGNDYQDEGIDVDFTFHLNQTDGQ